MSLTTAVRYHDISCGHRVVGHESKCAFLHGHNYRIHLTFMSTRNAPLDSLGRVIDFDMMKSTLCEWLETNWDHKFLAWEKDPVIRALSQSDAGNLRIAVPFRGVGPGFSTRTEPSLVDSIVWVGFNPTAENIAYHLLFEVGPKLLDGLGVMLTRVRVDETRKCSAEVER